MAFSWTCTCGRGLGDWSSSRERAMQEAELHRVRQGRLRDMHATALVSRQATGAA